MEPTQDTLRADDRADRRGELDADRVKRLGQRGEAARVEVGHQSAGSDDPGEVAMTGERIVEAEQALLEPAQARDRWLEADSGADVPEVADVVVEALELGQQDPCPSGACRNGGPGQRLERLRVGQRMGDGADAAGALHDRQRRGE
jgi:hypothetical protein